MPTEARHNVPLSRPYLAAVLGDVLVAGLASLAGRLPARPTYPVNILELHHALASPPPRPSGFLHLKIEHSVVL